MIFENLTWDDLCDMMCGKPEEEIYEVEEDVCIQDSCKCAIGDNDDTMRSSNGKTR